MNHEKYYDKTRDGSYIIHFPNKEGMSLSELGEIFSTFGKVVSIVNRGQIHGLCFIKYENVEDVIRCIDGLQNHSSIKILPHKHKICNQRKINTRLYVNNQFQDTNTDNHSNEKRLQNEKDYRSDSLNNALPIFRRSNNNDNNSFKTSGLKPLSKPQKLQKTASSTPDFSRTAKESMKRFEKSFDENEIPSLICTNQTPLISKITPAQEVIVANVHPSLGVHYVLHLFEKYNPLSVSFMMSIPRTGIRYCHVYFTTSEEALAAEEEFDMYPLHGSFLIVLRSQKLLEEALLI